MSKITDKRVPTGVAGLDEMLHGGLLPGTAMLVRGAPGTGKTLLGLQFLVQGAQRDEAGLLISFEEFPQSLRRDAESVGWDLSRLEEAGQLHIHFTSPRVFLNSLESPGSPLSQLMLTGVIQRVVLDSITHFTRLTVDQTELRKIYHSVINGLKREGVTSLLLGEEGRVPSSHFERGSLAYVLDGIILLRYVEMESTIQRAVAILKMRGSDHAKEIRRYEIRKNGLVVTGPFEGREGILSGIAHRITA